MFKKILFPTDFSEYARKTLDCIAGFPGAREVIIFHVIEAVRSPRGGGESVLIGLFGNLIHVIRPVRLPRTGAISPPLFLPDKYTLDDQCRIHPGRPPFTSTNVRGEWSD